VLGIGEKDKAESIIKFKGIEEVMGGSNRTASGLVAGIPLPKRAFQKK
jgi:hypothetical protein